MAEHKKQALPKYRLTVDLADLEMAFEDASPEVTHYLDLEIGKVVTITADIQFELLAVCDEMEESGGEGSAGFAAALRQRDLPEWMREALEEAHRVDTDTGSRYLPVPPVDSRAGFLDMRDFIGSVGHDGLRARLEGAIHGKGSFRRFKDFLARNPDEQERWHAFKDARVRQRVLDWLEAEGIEPGPE
jgi:hypothetical protein